MTAALTIERARSPLAVAVVLALVVPATAGGAAPGGEEDRIEQARRAVERVPFTARVVVEWVDGQGRHSAEVEVRSTGAVVGVGAPPGVPAAAQGLLPMARTWSLTWPGRGGAQDGSALGRKYDVRFAPGPPVASRPTTLVLLQAAGEVRERLAVDEATGLVLRREVLGEGGQAVRVVTVTRLELGPPPDRDLRARPAPPSPRREMALPLHHRAPAVLEGGYRHVGAYRRAGAVHLLYSDGLHGLSVFAEPGHLRRVALPSGGRPVRVGTASGVHYRWPGGEVLAWQAGGVVYTVVGDASFEDVLAAARSLPRERPPVLARLVRTCRWVSEVISGGR